MERENIFDIIHTQYHKLKEERNLFEEQFHHTLKCQAEDAEEYEKEIKKLKAVIKTLEEENEKLKSKYHDILGKCETAIDSKYDLEEENKKQIIFLWEHYDEWKNKDPFKFLKKNYK